MSRHLPGMFIWTHYWNHCSARPYWLLDLSISFQYKGELIAKVLQAQDNYSWHTSGRKFLLSPSWGRKGVSRQSCHLAEQPPRLQFQKSWQAPEDLRLDQPTTSSGAYAPFLTSNIQLWLPGSLQLTFKGGLETTFIQQNWHWNPVLSTAEQGQRHLLSLHQWWPPPPHPGGTCAVLTCGGSTVQPLVHSPSVSAALLEISKELDFPVSVGQRTKQTGYLCLGCFRQSKKPQLLDQISTYKGSNAQNIISLALGIYHPGRDSSAHFTALCAKGAGCT